MPMISMGLGYELSPHLSSDDLFMIRKSNMPARPYLSQNAIQFAVMYTLRDIVGTLNLWGLSGNDLIDDLMFRRGKNLEKRIKDAGHHIEECGELQKIIKDMESDASIYFEETICGGERCMIPMLVIKQRTIYEKTLDMCGITGTNIHIKTQAPSTIDEVTLAAQMQQRPLDADQYDVGNSLYTPYRKEDLSKTGIHIDANEQLTISGSDFYSDNDINIVGKRLLKLCSKLKRISTEHDFHDDLTLQNFVCKGKINILVDGVLQKEAINCCAGVSMDFKADHTYDLYLDAQSSHSTSVKNDSGFSNITTYSSKAYTSHYGILRDDDFANRHGLPSDPSQGSVNSTSKKMDVYAPSFDASVVNITTTEGGFHAHAVTDFNASHVHRVDKGFGYRDEDIRYNQTVSSRGLHMQQKGARLNINSASHVTLEAVQADNVNVKMLAGELRLLLGKTVSEYFDHSMSKDMAWMSGHTKHIENTQYHEDGIKHLTVEGADRIVVEVQDCVKDIYDRMIVLDGTPIETIVCENTEKLLKDEKYSKPGAGLLLLAAIGAALATFGAASSLGGVVAQSASLGTTITVQNVTTFVLSTTGTMTSGAVAGATMAAASTFATALVANQMNVKDTLRDVFSRQGLKNFVIGAVAGGALAGLGCIPADGAAATTLDANIAAAATDPSLAESLFKNAGLKFGEIPSVLSKCALNQSAFFFPTTSMAANIMAKNTAAKEGIVAGLLQKLPEYTKLSMANFMVKTTTEVLVEKQSLAHALQSTWPSALAHLVQCTLASQIGDAYQNNPNMGLILHDMTHFGAGFCGGLISSKGDLGCAALSGLGAMISEHIAESLTSTHAFDVRTAHALAEMIPVLFSIPFDLNENQLSHFNNGSKIALEYNHGAHSDGKKDNSQQDEEEDGEVPGLTIQGRSDVIQRDGQHNPPSLIDMVNANVSERVSELDKIYQPRPLSPTTLRHAKRVADLENHIHKMESLGAGGSLHDYMRLTHAREEYEKRVEFKQKIYQNQDMANYAQKNPARATAFVVGGGLVLASTAMTGGTLPSILAACGMGATGVGLVTAANGGNARDIRDAVLLGGMPASQLRFLVPARLGVSAFGLWEENNTLVNGGLIATGSGVLLKGKTAA